MSGIEGGGKIREIARWVRTYKVKNIRLIETMSNNIGEHSIRRMWGSDDYKWAFAEAQGRSGGILCIWDQNFISEATITEGEGGFRSEVLYRSYKGKG